MRVLFYINLLAIVVISGALAQMYQGQPLPWVHKGAHVVAGVTPAEDASIDETGAATPAPNPHRADDAIASTDAIASKEKTVAAGTKVLRVFTEGAYPPFNGRNASGELVGYDIDIAKEICVRLERECMFETRNWRVLLPALKRGEADMVVASMLVPSDTGNGMKPSPEIVFSTPYYKTPGHFASRRDANAAGASMALSKQTIAVQAGSTHEAFLKARFGKAKLLALPSLAEAEDALVDRRADLIFGDRNALLNWMKRGGGDGCCHMVGGDYDDPTFFAHGAGIALRASDKALLADIDDALNAMRRDGTEMRMARPYFGQSIQ